MCRDLRRDLLDVEEQLTLAAYRCSPTLACLRPLLNDGALFLAAMVELRCI